MPSVGDYLALVSSWHSSKPRFMFTLASLLEPLIEVQYALEQLRTTNFDLDQAVGIQLDLIGAWMNRNRYIEVPILNVFFSLDEPGQRVGLDQGVWLGAYQPTDAISALDDETYRMILKLQAIANQWDGTMESIAPLLQLVYPGVLFNDLGDQPGHVMSMEVLVPGNISTLLLEILEQDFPVKPSGVRVNIIQTTVVDELLFGLDHDPSDGGPWAGLDEGAWGQVVAAQ